MSLFSEFRLYLCNNWVNGIPSHKFRLWFYRRIMRFQIGDGSTCLMRCVFDRTKGFEMGKNSVINANCRLDTRGSIVIGDNVSISSDVIILTADHDMDAPDMKGRNREVIIDSYVWIGTRAMIMPGVRLSRGAVVGAGSVVTKSVEPFTVVAGVPAKKIKMRLCQDRFSYSATYMRLFQ